MCERHRRCIARAFLSKRDARALREFPVVESDGLYEHGVLDMHRGPRNEVNEDNEANEIEGNEVNEVDEVNVDESIKSKPFV